MILIKEWGKSGKDKEVQFVKFEEKDEGVGLGEKNRKKSGNFDNDELYDLCLKYIERISGR